MRFRSMSRLVWIAFAVSLFAMSAFGYGPCDVYSPTESPAYALPFPQAQYQNGSVPNVTTPLPQVGRSGGEPPKAPDASHAGDIKPEEKAQ